MIPDLLLFLQLSPSDETTYSAAAHGHQRRSYFGVVARSYLAANDFGIADRSTQGLSVQFNL
jgi:hypothetical protein